jgi:hypothetical protein
MSPAEFGRARPVSGRLHIHDLHRAAAGIDLSEFRSSFVSNMLLHHSVMSTRYFKATTMSRNVGQLVNQLRGAVFRKKGDLY